MKARCKLYRFSDTKQRDRISIDSYPIKNFDDILDKENCPFHDEISVNFLTKLGIHYADDMHLKKNGTQYAIHNFCDGLKETLMLFHNSREGIYTDMRHKDWDLMELIDEFDEYELLLAVDVENIKSHPFPTHFRNVMIENFPFKGSHISVDISSSKYPEDKELVYKVGDWFELYYSSKGYFSNGNFFELYVYDWKRDLPFIKDYIDMSYQFYKSYDTYEKQCTVYDLCNIPERGYAYYEDWKDYKVLNHMISTKKLETDCRKIPQVAFLYRKDGSVELHKTISNKYPEMGELLTEYDYQYRSYENLKYVYCLFIDVEEVIRDISDFKQTWFGAYFYLENNSIELFDKDQALIEFSKQIPYVLQNMSIPIKGDRELSGW